MASFRDAETSSARERYNVHPDMSEESVKPNYTKSYVGQNPKTTNRILF
ncbi:hypothetical protein JYU05_01020 [bacterium AH-315-P13]|nr:hypothetical protein [bacterium AH-315-P13]